MNIDGVIDVSRAASARSAPACAAQLTPALRALLLRSDLLDGVAPSALHYWLTEAPVRHICKGETLIRVGQAHHTLFLVLSGTLSVWPESVSAAYASGSQGAASAALLRKQVARIGPGETVGEQSLIDGQLPTAWAVAEQDCCVLAVPAALFWQATHTEPRIALNLMRVLCTRVRQVTASFSEAIVHQQRLTQDAETDALTGLYNRRWMDRHYPPALQCHHAAARPASILMIDIDHFKRVNDEHGHAVGDQVLFQAARRIKLALRPGDLCARYGGEEFCVLLPAVDLSSAKGIADRICAAVARQPFVLSSGLTLPVSVSIGVACWNQQERLHALLHAADSALYQAKRQGRNQVIASRRPQLA